MSLFSDRTHVEGRNAMADLASLEQRALQELQACGDEAALRAWHTQYFGDQNHPTGWGTQKVANQLLKWLQNTLPSSQSYLSDWFGYGGTGTPWILQ